MGSVKSHNAKAPPPVREHRRGLERTCTDQASTGDSIPHPPAGRNQKEEIFLKLEIDLPWGGKLIFERKPMSEDARSGLLAVVFMLAMLAMFWMFR